MYVKWYGGVYAFHISFNLCIIYGAGICVDVCSVVVCYLLLESGCFLLCCYVV